MATVNRPPFWVPRPPDDNIWYAQPISPRSIVLATTEKKFYGAPGQVPTLRWLPYYTLNDPPEWQGAPVHSQSLVLATTELKWYGAPGQVPTKRWLPQYTQDDPPPWAPTPDNLISAVINLLTHQQIFGAGGQVPPSRWNFNYDETPPWAPTADNLNSNIISQLTHQQFFGAGGQVPTKDWSPYLWDDPSPVWQFDTNWMNSAVIQLLTQQKIFGAGGQVPTKNWAPLYTQDDPPMWQGSPVNSQSLVLSKTELKWYGAPGQVPPARWNFNYDETGPWQWTLQERNPNLLTVSAAHNPFIPVPWQFNYDETPAWAAQPTASNVEFIPSNVPRAAFYALKPGDEHFWQPAVQRNINLFPAASTTKPFVPNFWNFNYDETGPVEFWKPYATNTTFTLSSFVQYAPRNNWEEWFAELDDPPVWQWAPYRNINVNPLITPAAPGVPRIWTFRTDPDDVGWLGQPVAVNINFVPVNVPRAAFYALRPGDEQVWAAAPRAVNPSQFPQLPPVNVLNIYRWWFNYDQDPMWQGQPLPGLIVNVPVPPVVGPGVYNTMLLCVPGGMFSIPGNPPS